MQKNKALIQTQSYSYHYNGQSYQNICQYRNKNILSQHIGSHYLTVGLICSLVVAIRHRCTNFPNTYKPSQYFIIMGGRQVPRTKFHTENPQIWRAIIQNLAAMVNWRLGLVSPLDSSLSLKVKKIGVLCRSVLRFVRYGNIYPPKTPEASIHLHFNAIIFTRRPI